MSLIEMYGDHNTNSGSLMDQYSDNHNTETSLVDMYAGDHTEVSLVDMYAEQSFDNHILDSGRGLDNENSSDFMRKAWVAGENENAGLLGSYQGINEAIKTHLKNDISRTDGQDMDTAIVDMLFNDKDSPIDEIIGRRIGFTEKTKAGFFSDQTMNIVAQTKIMDKTGIGRSGISELSTGKGGNTIDSNGEFGNDDWENTSELDSFNQLDWTNGPDIFADPYEDKKQTATKENSDNTQYNVFNEKSNPGVNVKDILTGKGQNPFDMLGNKIGGREVKEVLTGSSVSNRKYDNAFLVAKENHKESDVKTSGDPSETQNDWSSEKDSWSQEEDSISAGEIMTPAAIFAGLSVSEKLSQQKTVSEQLSEKLGSKDELFKGQSVAEKLAEDMRKKRFISDVPGVEFSSVSSDEFLITKLKKEEKGSKDIRSIIENPKCSSGLIGCGDDEVDDQLNEEQEKIAKSVFGEKNSIENKLKRLEEKLSSLTDEEIEIQRQNMIKKDTYEAKMVLHCIVSVQQSRKISAEIKARGTKKQD